MKGTEEKKVKGWSTEEMKDKPGSSLAEDTEENEDMEIFEPRGDGSMLEEFGRKNGSRSSFKYKVEDSK